MKSKKQGMKHHNWTVLIIVLIVAAIGAYFVYNYNAGAGRAYDFTYDTPKLESTKTTSINKIVSETARKAERAAKPIAKGKTCTLECSCTKPEEVAFTVPCDKMVPKMPMDELYYYIANPDKVPDKVGPICEATSISAANWKDLPPLTANDVECTGTITYS